jgi:voltage-gated sodium channel
MILVARLLRVFRVLRLVSIVPDLRILINALLKAIPKMGYIGLLMFILFYLFGAVGAIFFEPVNEKLWGDISVSMLTLFRIATFEDWTDVMYETMEVYPFSWIFYILFIFLTAFVFLNMMVGVVLEVMSQETSAKEHQEQEDHHQALVAQLSALQKQVQSLSDKLDERNRY